MRLLLILAALALAPVPAAAQSLLLKGPDGRTATLNAADLKAMPRVTLVLTVGASRYEYQGVLLKDLAVRVGAPDQPHGPDFAQTVLVKAGDGYRVAFGLGELDKTLRTNRVILADTVDGGPLEANDGPFKVFAEGDMRPARGVRQVTEIELVRH